MSRNAFFPNGTPFMERIHFEPRFCRTCGNKRNQEYKARERARKETNG